MAAATQGDMVSLELFSSPLTLHQGAFVKALQKDKAGDGGDGKDAPEDMALD